MITVILRVDFKPYTSQDWIFQELLKVGLRGTVPYPTIDIDAHGFDGQFQLGGTLNGCFALVRTSEESRWQITRDLRLIPAVTRIRELNTRGA